MIICECSTQRRPEPLVIKLRIQDSLFSLMCFRSEVRYEMETPKKMWERALDIATDHLTVTVIELDLPFSQDVTQPPILPLAK